MTALRCTCKNGGPYCAAHPSVPLMMTADLVQKIRDESRAAGLESQAVFIGETAVIVVQNPCRVTPRGPELVLGFYVAKIHNGKLVSEQFV